MSFHPRAGFSVGASALRPRPFSATACGDACCFSAKSESAFRACPLACAGSDDGRPAWVGVERSPPTTSRTRAHPRTTAHMVVTVEDEEDCRAPGCWIAGLSAIVGYSLVYRLPAKRTGSTVNLPNNAAVPRTYGHKRFLRSLTRDSSLGNRGSPAACACPHLDRRL